jgi:cysteinyl-tRNA synthetase
MDWTEDAAERAEAKLLEFSVLLHRFAPNHVPNIAAVSKEVIQALSDDMNTYASLIALDQTFKRCIELGDARQLANDLEFLGITRYAGSPIEPEAEWIWELPQKINSFSARLQALKVEAIEKRDFSKVDQLKSDLSRIGIKVMMRKESVDLEIDYFAVYQNMLIERNDPRFNQLTGVDRREVAKWLEQKLDTLI